ncbi:NAD(P)H pyrophosphatase NUDT13, mitochondrial isoform X2 [Narcine bancroftii]|uniref:NAD(P)H pyrophosphatase NUDT13, mitochondrial isoform X2 n=1 Tax=Narcine bancroftii TaxID=1343680 RepID=UPI0038315EF6
MMHLFVKNFNTPTLQLSCRMISNYVTRIRHLCDLKEDDEACRNALSSGTFLLFHGLSPLLQKIENKYITPSVSASELSGILKMLGQAEKRMEESVLIGCSESLVPQFALDLGKMEKARAELLLKGKFVEFQKAFFLLDGKNAPLLSQMSPVVIMLVSDGARCLLARQEGFPPRMFSALAGFCNIGETVEDSVHREVAEEVGLDVSSLVYSASQHWPFPSSSLMIGCHAMVQPKQNKINLNHSELEDARWFDAGEIAEALKRKMPSKEEMGEIEFWVPPPWALAHRLIKEWIQEQQQS